MELIYCMYMILSIQRSINFTQLCSHAFCYLHSNYCTQIITESLLALPLSQKRRETIYAIIYSGNAEAINMKILVSVSQRGTFDVKEVRKKIEVELGASLTGLLIRRDTSGQSLRREACRCAAILNKCYLYLFYLLFVWVGCKGLCQYLIFFLKSYF